MRRLLPCLEFAFILAVTFPVSLLPLAAAQYLGDMFGVLAYHLLKGRKKIALEGIRKTLEAGCLQGHLSAEEIARNSFKNLGRSFIELIKIYRNRGARIFNAVTIEGMENYEAARAFRKGVLIVTGHYGSWELLALYFSHHIAQASVVARKQENLYLNALIERIRKRYGNSIIYKQGAIKKILNQLKNEGIIGILYDQSVLQGEGVLVDFLCRKAWTMKAPVLFSQKTGAPLLPAFIQRTAEGHKITFHPHMFPDKDIDIEIHLEILNAYLEEHIKEDPSQWLWIHRRWKRANA